MQRADLLALMDYYKTKAGGVNDFMIQVSQSEARPVAMTLVYLKADGTIIDFYRMKEPDDCSFYIEGYTS